jgi:protein arginine N-methyltransferase 1
MYSVDAYGMMISDKVRMTAYTDALRKCVKPGSIVVDIGCGTGIFSLLACQFGASKVFAIEPDKSIQLARESAKACGYADRIEFIQELSTHTHLSDQADVIISDLRGVLPLFQKHIPSIIDARQRFLVPGGIMIPQQDKLWITPIEDSEIYNGYTEPWDNRYGLNLDAAKRVVTNSWRKAKITSSQFLAAPECWGVLHYPRINDADIKGELCWVANRTGTFHGLCAWFDTELLPDISFSSAPDEPEVIYGQAFFPLLEPVSLSTGDTIELSFEAKLTGEDYTWIWNTKVLHQGDRARQKASFKQSTFFGEPLSLDQLRKQGSNHKPSRNTEGEITHKALTYMDENTSLDEIAHRLLTGFPDYFSTYNDALIFAGELSYKYSR